MLFKKIIFLLIILSSLTCIGQENNRINKIQNQLEQLKGNYPEFAETVNVNITNTSLSNFLLAISKVHDININVSPALDSIPIINNFSNVSIHNLLIFLAKEHNLTIEIMGNIISVSKYQAPVMQPVVEKITASYNPSHNLLSLDIKNDPLEKVFRRITDVSGKNIVFAPGMENLKLSFYAQNVSFESAMENLALSNNLQVTQSRDGFFIFNSAQSVENGKEVYSAIRTKDNFYYRVIDSINKIIEVDFKNIPASDIIYTLGEDLGINIFTASSLKDMGLVSVKAENIHFDNLLNNIFESLNSNPGNNINSLKQEKNLNQINVPDQSTFNTNSHYTYKKERELYFFGTEDQLALKEIAVIQLMHRSIEMLSNPSGYSERNNGNRNNFPIGGANNLYGGRINSNYNQQFQDNEIQSSSPTLETTTEAIQKIIPESLQRGLDIKIDSELNSFIVSGPAARVERFENFIHYIDKPVPVILIEVMIIEVNKTTLVETGVSFGLAEEPVTTQGQAFPSVNMNLGAKTINRIIGGFDGFGSLNLGKVMPNFYMNIKALESNGNLKILSTPKLSTLNGHRAHLSSGETTYYAVTNQSFFGSQIPQVSEITNYYPIDAELAIDILPFVSGDGQITLDINVVQSSFNGERISEDAPPGMNSREFSSIIRMRDQDVAILGGIEQSIKDDSGTGVPLLSRIPIIKWLFSSRKREDSKKKLNILIKPTVIY